MDFLTKVNELNARAGQLNQQRQRNMGQLETLQRQLNDDIAMYNKTYGTSLTLDGVEAEYKKVSEEVAQKAKVIEQVISCIEAGNFKEAEALVSGGTSVGDGVVVDNRADVEVATKANLSVEAKPSISDMVMPDPDTVEEIKAPSKAPSKDLNEASSEAPSEVEAPVTEPSGIFSQSLGSADEDEAVPYEDTFLDGVTPKPVGVSTSEQAVDDDDDDVPLAPPKGTVKPPSFASVLDGTGFGV